MSPNCVTVILTVHNRDCSTDSFECLRKAITDAGEWPCEIRCHGYSIHKPLLLDEYNICEYLVHSPHLTSSELTLTELKLWQGSNFKFDPTEFHGQDHRQDIKKYIINACKLAGFKVEAHVKLNLPTKKRPNPSKTCRIQFKCALNKKSICEMPNNIDGKKYMPLKT